MLVSTKILNGKVNLLNDLLDDEHSKYRYDSSVNVDVKITPMILNNNDVYYVAIFKVFKKEV